MASVVIKQAINIIGVAKDSLVDISIPHMMVATSTEAVGIVAVEDTVVAVAGTVVVKAGSLIIVAGTAAEVDITIAFINLGTIAVVVKLDSVKGDTFEVKKE